MWAKIDAAQLRGWQFVVNQYGKHTGRNQYDVARFLAVVYAAGMVVDAFNGVTFPERMIGSLLALVALVATAVMFLGANWEEKSAIRRFLGTTHNNRNRWPNVFNRTVQSAIFYISMVSCFVLWRVRPIDLSYLGMWGYWYVMICDPPPPPKEEESVNNLVPEGA